MRKIYRTWSFRTQVRKADPKEAFMTHLKTSLLAGAALLALAGTAGSQPLPQQNDSYFTAAEKHLADMLARKPIDGKAKNVILFVGDGLSIATTTAARIL
jgi:alkaline phosphatase